MRSKEVNIVKSNILFIANMEDILNKEIEEVLEVGTISDLWKYIGMSIVWRRSKKGVLATLKRGFE